MEITHGWRLGSRKLSNAVVGRGYNRNRGRSNAGSSSRTPTKIDPLYMGAVAIIMHATLEGPFLGATALTSSHDQVHASTKPKAPWSKSTFWVLGSRIDPRHASRWQESSHKRSTGSILPRWCRFLSAPLFCSSYDRTETCLITAVN